MFSNNIYTPEINQPNNLFFDRKINQHSIKSTQKSVQPRSITCDLRSLNNNYPYNLNNTTWIPVEFTYLLVGKRNYKPRLLTATERFSFTIPKLTQAPTKNFNLSYKHQKLFDFSTQVSSIYDNILLKTINPFFLFFYENSVVLSLKKNDKVCGDNTFYPVFFKKITKYFLFKKKPKYFLKKNKISEITNRTRVFFDFFFDSIGGRTGQVIQRYRHKKNLLKQLKNKHKHDIILFFKKNLKPQPYHLDELPLINHKNVLNESMLTVKYDIGSPQRELTNFKNNFFKKKNLQFFNTYFDSILPTHILLLFFKNPFLNKINFLINTVKYSNILRLHNIYSCFFKKNNNIAANNILPSRVFNYAFFKKIYNSNINNKFKPLILPWHFNNLIRFIEFISGYKSLIQFYPFMSQEISHDFVARYKFWLPRLNYFERKLGHRFFLEESIHILHLGFFLKDANIIAQWLRSLIMRINFWKTRSIFRFLKYLLNNYFLQMFTDLGVKGLKLKLKGKISVAGSSRKRTILFRVGKTSHSTVDLRVLHEIKTISTFTGVMGFQVWLFY